MKLSKRLEHLALAVNKNRRVADIGTDHGLLPVKLVLDGTARSAIAMDLRKGPLERARAHIKEYGLEEKIQTRLSDGMRELQEDEVDTIVIAGLGGELMIEMLRAREDLHHKEFVLSPHSEWKSVRKYLRENQMRIVDEDMVLDERNKYYIILQVKGTKCRRANGGGWERNGSALESKAKESRSLRRNTDSDDRYDCFGEKLIQKKHPVLLSYLEYEEGKYKEILSDLQKKGFNEKLQQRIREIKEYLEMIHTTRGEML